MTFEGARRRRRPPRRGPAAAVFVVAVFAGAMSPVSAQDDPLARRAGLTVEGESLDGALRLLQSSAQIALVYSPDLLPDRTVDCACRDVTVREALEAMLEGTGLTFVAGRTLVRIVPIRRDGPPATTGVIEGRVVDVDRGIPIVNVRVRVDESRGVLSDTRGAFVVRDLSPGFHSLRVESIGWESAVREVEILAGDTATVEIDMTPRPVALPALVVAPGTFGLLEDVSPGAARMLTREEVATLPQVGEDVLRAVKRLPGVTSDDISTRLHVRGGTDRDVLIRLDGLELVEPYHLKDWNGILGIVDVHALGGVELTSGGFGAEYGGKTAGVLDMTSRTWIGDTKSTLGASISNVTAMTRGSFDGGRGAWLASARRGFLDLVLDLIGENDAFSPQYYDVFGRLTYQVTPKHVLSARVLHAGDVFKYRETPGAGADGVDDVDVDTSWDSSYGWITWEATPRPRVSATTMLSAGRVTRDRVGFVLDEEEVPQFISTDDHRKYTFAGLRNDLSIGLTDDVLLKLGGEARWGRAEYDFANLVRFREVTPDTLTEPRFDSVSVDLKPSGHELGAYVGVRVRPAQRLTAEVGLRYDETSHTHERDLSPRALASLDVSPQATVRASWGLYRQPHKLYELEVGDGETGYYPSERASQVAIGFENRFADGVVFRLEAYQRWLRDQPPHFYNARQEIEVFPEATGDRMRIVPSEGRTRGIEVVLERRSGPDWAWSASYALAAAEDRFGGAWTPRLLDQTHTVGFHLSYTPASRWNVSLGWRYHSGWPATRWNWYALPLADGSIAWFQAYQGIRGDRLPAYHRLDVRVTREFRLGGGVLQAFVDLFNVYGRTNLGSWGYSSTYSSGRLSVERVNGEEQLPRLPLLGLRYEF